jgi:arylsulfatase A-like enzyme
MAIKKKSAPKRAEICYLYSSLYEYTIFVFTSDHGELLGAHRGLTQKWYCAYEEAMPE